MTERSEVAHCMENPIYIGELRKQKKKVDNREKQHFAHIYKDIISRLEEMRDYMNKDDYERIKKEFALDSINY